MDQANLTLVSSVVAATAAMIAAVPGVLSIWWRYADRQDRLRVGLGRIRFDLSETTDLHAINISSHPVEIADYGFVLMDGKLMSLPIFWETDAWESEKGWSRQNRRLGPRESFEAGTEIRGQVAGAYAITSTQRRPTVRMSPDLGLLRGRWLWLRAWLLQEYA